MILYKTFLIDGLALIKIWAIGFFGLNVSGIIHILPIIAMLALIASLLSFKSFLR